MAARRPTSSTGTNGSEAISAPPVRANTGLTLLVPDQSMDLSAVVLALRRRGLRPVVTPLAKNVFQIIANWSPRATIVQAGVVQWDELVRFLSQRHIPTVVIGDPRQLHRVRQLGGISVGIVTPAEPNEIADAAEMLIGPSGSGRPDKIDLGSIYIDVAARMIWIDNEKIQLPPKEFDILVQLALRPGEPVSSPELIRTLWPASATTTAEDVHCRVSRLRGYIGDRQRAVPLVSNRRGFGYVLNVPAGKVD
jgi:DNA-binding response OmpR family regulator